MRERKRAKYKEINKVVKNVTSEEAKHWMSFFVWSSKCNLFSKNLTRILLRIFDPINMTTDNENIVKKNVIIQNH